MLMALDATTMGGTAVGTAVVSESVGVTPSNTGSLSENGVAVGFGVGVSVGVGVTVGILVGVLVRPPGVKVAVGSRDGMEVGGGRVAAGTGVKVAGTGVAAGTGAAASTVGANVGSTNAEEGPHAIRNTDSNRPRAKTIRKGAIHLPSATLTAPHIRLDRCLLQRYVGVCQANHHAATRPLK